MTSSDEKKKKSFLAKIGQKTKNGIRKLGETNLKMADKIEKSYGVSLLDDKGSLLDVFLSDDEKFILKRDSSKLNLSQSEYIRNLIVGYKIKIPEVKEEPKPKKEEYIIENIAKALEENIECLIKVKNKFHYLGYFEDERAIGTKIEYLKLQNTTLKKYIPIENDKDNAI